MTEMLDDSSGERMCRKGSDLSDKKCTSRKKPTVKSLEVIKKITGKNDGKEVSIPSRQGGK